MVFVCSYSKAHPNLIIATSFPKYHMVPVKVNGKEVKFLLNTGSAATLFRLNTWKQSKNKPDHLEKWNEASLVARWYTVQSMAIVSSIAVCKQYFCSL